MYFPILKYQPDPFTVIFETREVKHNFFLLLKILSDSPWWFISIQNYFWWNLNLSQDR